MTDNRALLLHLYAAGLAAVNGERAVYQALQEQGGREPCHIVAIGKAAEAMLRGANRYLRDHRQTSLLITKTGHVADATRQMESVQVIESAHPVPDECSLAAGQALLDFLHELPEQAHVLFLISGGASSLVEVLEEGYALQDLQQATSVLLANGADIREINAMRRELSRIKGGKLWHFLGNRQVRCLLLSDVLGDDPQVIGSGLLFPSPRADFDWRIVASNGQALQAMAAAALPDTARIMPDFLSGEAETAAQACIEHLRQSEPGVYLWGAETTVFLPPDPGRGGRNQHFALAAANALQEDDAIFLLAAGTDGTDGMSEDAGALVDNGTIRRGKMENLDPDACLLAADAGTFLDASGDLIHTGPTGTNVMDVVIGLKQ